MPGSANHEHVAESLIENDLRGHATVRTPKEHYFGILAGGQLRPASDVLAGVVRRSMDKALIARLEVLPDGLGIQCITNHACDYGAQHVWPRHRLRAPMFYAQRPRSPPAR